MGAGDGDRVPGGEVVRDTSPGKGVRFAIEFPVA